MKIIKITKGHEVMVDDEDYLDLMKWKWQAHGASRNKLYAARTERVFHIIRNGTMFISMHRSIMGLSFNEPHLTVDHIDGNSFNNQKYNLRICSQKENSKNKRHGLNSKYKGAERSGKLWKSRISVNYQQIHIGTFKTETEAAIAYNLEAVKNFGEFARLNDVNMSIVPIKINREWSSKYSGVGFDKSKNRWLVYLYNKGMRKYIGRFKTELDAAIAYNKCALEILGEKAKLNII